MKLKRLHEKTLHMSLLRHADEGLAAVVGGSGKIEIGSLPYNKVELDTSQEYEKLELTPGAPWKDGPLSLDGKYWKFRMSSSGGTVRVDDLIFKKGVLDKELEYKQCHHSEIAIDTLIWKDFRLQLVEGGPLIDLPLTDEFVLGHYQLAPRPDKAGGVGPAGYTATSKEHKLWRLEFIYDASVEVVYAWGFDKGKPVPLKLKQKGKADGTSVEVVVPDDAFLAVVSLANTWPAAKVEPLEALLAGKFFPLVLGRARKGKTYHDFQASVELIRPQVSSMKGDWLDPQSLMSGELFSDVNRKTWHGWAAAPFWSEVFAYGLVEPPPEKKYLLVDRATGDHDNLEVAVEHKVGGALLNFDFLADGVQLLPTIPTPLNPVAFNLPLVGPPLRVGYEVAKISKLVIDLWDRYRPHTVEKVSRQAEFDNWHFAPKYLYERYDWEALLIQAYLKLSGSPWNVERGAAKYLVPMAPLCHCDCLHTHIRWGSELTRSPAAHILGDAPHVWGWGGWDKPNSVPGAVQAPPNQRVWLSCKGGKAGDRAFTNGFNYSISASPVDSKHWQVAFHHGTAISLILNPEVVGRGIDFARMMLFGQTAPGSGGFMPEKLKQILQPEGKNARQAVGFSVDLLIRMALHLAKVNVDPATTTVEAALRAVGLDAVVAKLIAAGLNKLMLVTLDGLAGAWVALAQEIDRRLDMMEEMFKQLILSLGEATWDEMYIFSRLYFIQRYSISTGEERLAYRGGARGLRRLCLAGLDPTLTLKSASYTASEASVSFWDEKLKLERDYDLQVVVRESDQVVLQSDVVWNDNTPSWTEQTATPSSVLPGAVEVEVYDKLGVIGSRSLGKATLTLPDKAGMHTGLQVSCGPGTVTFDYEVPASWAALEKLRGEERKDHWEKYVSRELNPGTPTRYLMLEGAVIKRNETWVPGLKVGPRPDLLVTIYLPEKEADGTEYWSLKFRSRVYQDSFTPVWRQPTPIPCIAGQRAQIVVWDKDFGEDDHLGTVQLTVDPKQQELVLKGFGLIDSLKFSQWDVWERIPPRPATKTTPLFEFDPREFYERVLPTVNPARQMELAVCSAFDSLHKSRLEARARLRHKLEAWRKILPEATHSRLSRVLDSNVRSGAFGELIWGALQRANDPDGSGRERLLRFIEAHDALVGDMRGKHEDHDFFNDLQRRADQTEMSSYIKFYKDTIWTSDDNEENWLDFIRERVKDDYVTLVCSAHYANTLKQTSQNIDWSYVKAALKQLKASRFVRNNDWGQVSGIKDVFVTAGEARFQALHARTEDPSDLLALQKRIYWQVQWSMRALEHYYASSAWLDQAPDREAMKKVCQAHYSDLEKVWQGRELRTMDSDSPKDLGRPWYNNDGFMAEMGKKMLGLDYVQTTLEQEGLANSWPE